MSEEIAKVLADLKSRRVKPAVGLPLFKMALGLVDDPVVVDCTSIYRALVAKETGVHIYEDHPNIAPPWPEAAFCYVNGHGNVIVMHARVDEVADRGELWETAQPVDWGNIRWVINVFVWVGGRSGNGIEPTHGPRHLWQFAVCHDGAPADLHWVHIIPDYPMERWDMAHLVVLGALNFLSCRNVSVEVPAVDRRERRRLARIGGPPIHTIMVYPPRETARSAATGGTPAGGQSVTPARGHFAHYGPAYGNGLLFGKLAGKFWIPRSATAKAANYKLRT